MLGAEGEGVKPQRVSRIGVLAPSLMRARQDKHPKALEEARAKAKLRSQIGLRMNASERDMPRLDRIQPEEPPLVFDDACRKANTVSPNFHGTPFEMPRWLLSGSVGFC